MSEREVVWRCRTQVVVRTDDLELAGGVVQDAAAYLGLADVHSTAHFPSHMQEFQEVMGKVSTHHLNSTTCCICCVFVCQHRQSAIKTKV